MFGDLGFRSTAASAFAEQSDLLFGALCALTLLFTVLVCGVLGFLAVRYRRGSDVDRSRPSSHNTVLELTWSIIPLIMALGIFAWSAKLYATAYAIPPNAKDIFVIGKQWMWHIQHENGIRENNELHLAVDEPVKLTMISQDVIHAFFVPEFRIQRHVEPGNYTSIWFQPTRTGRFHLYCNMYCGMQHSEMGGWVYVMSRTDYQKWLATGGAQPVAIGGSSTPTGGLTMAQQGAALFQSKQCAACHDANAVTRGRGPSLIGIYNKSRQLADNRVVKADDGYLRNAIFYPNEVPLAGWPQGMPSYRGVLTEEEVTQLTSYVRSLSGGAPAGATTAPAGPGTARTRRGGAGAGAANNGAAANPAQPLYSDQHQGGLGPAEGEAGTPDGTAAPAANTGNQQWRYMYGGEQNQ